MTFAKRKIRRAINPPPPSFINFGGCGRIEEKGLLYEKIFEDS
jgi:hypothetical protein